MVSNDLINQIVDKADIVEVVSTYIKLEKKGADYKGICPFHNDTSPSLSVSPAKKVFKCFACGTSGNVLGFVQKFKNVTFMEALREVADTVGIKVESGESDEKYQKLKSIYAINESASDFYKLYLANSTEGEDAIKYLNNRNLSKEVIDRFSIGLSPNDDLLFKSFENKYLPIDLVQAGLVREGNNGFYDIFKERIMFPITNLQGRVVAFSGRIYNKEKSPNNPKYLNTIDTIAFKKSELLYNYFESMNDIKQNDSVYLFEGYMDVIAAYRCGINNCVASMGTSLTNGQIKAISKLTKNVIVCYDGDTPGINATKNAIILFSKQNIQVKVVSFEDNLDPDEYINKYGSQRLHDKLSNPISSIEFIYETEKKYLYIEDPNSVETFKTNVFEFLRQLNSNIMNEIIFKKMSFDLSINIDAIRNDFGKNDSYSSHVDSYHEGYLEGYNQGLSQNTPVVVTNEQSNERVSMKRYYKAEEGLIKLAYNNKQNCLKINGLLEGRSSKKEYGDLLNQIYLFYRKNEIMDIELLRQFLKDDVQMGLLMSIINNQYFPQVSSLEELVKIVKSSSDAKYLNMVYNQNRPITIEDIEIASKIKRKNIRKREK